MNDPYKILGVARNSSDEEIKQAYKRLVKEHHPDRPNGNEEKFKQVNDAYERIKNGEESFNFDSSAFARKTPFDFDDLFAQHFGKVQRNKSVETTYYVDIVDVFNTATKSIQLQLSNGTSRIVNIQIPRGVTNGAKVRYQGYGENIKQGPAGDLLVTFVINDHPKFKVEEYDIIYPLTINVKEAMIGTEKTIETLDNRHLKLHIKAGTQPNTRLRIPEAGLPKRNLPNGNLYIEIKIHIPVLTEQDLDKKLQDLL